MTVITLPSITVSELTGESLPVASDLMHRNWHRLYAGQLPAAIVRQRSREHFDRYLSGRIGQAWLAWRGDSPAGLVTLTSNCIDELWVEQRWRRRGIGSKLLETALGQLRQKGFSGAQAGIESGNQPAAAFYAAARWRRIGSERIRLQEGLAIEAEVYITNID